MKTQIFPGRMDKCTACGLYRNQASEALTPYPADVMFVGISSQKLPSGCASLPSGTITGNVVDRIMQEARKENHAISDYRTNIVKCLPLDSDGKIRMPEKEEISHCMENFISEYQAVHPKVVVLFGKLVQGTVAKTFKITSWHPCMDNSHIKYAMQDGVMFLSVYHPSYVYRYRHQELETYIKDIVTLILV